MTRNNFLIYYTFRLTDIPTKVMTIFVDFIKKEEVNTCHFFHMYRICLFTTMIKLKLQF